VIVGSGTDSIIMSSLRYDRVSVPAFKAFKEVKSPVFFPLFGSGSMGMPRASAAFQKRPDRDQLASTRNGGGLGPTASRISVWGRACVHWTVETMDIVLCVMLLC
jgi:hypothetical protein